MTQTEYVNIILNRPACIAWAGPSEDEKKNVVDDAVSSALKIVSRERTDFDFARGEGTATSLADTSTYVLKGNDDDCRTIINVRIGDNSHLLDEYTVEERDMRLSGLTSFPTSPSFWVPLARVNNFPQIEIVGTLAAGETIRYRYKSKAGRIEEFPEDFSDVIVAIAEAEVFGTVGVALQSTNYVSSTDPRHFERRAKNKLENMIDEYEASSGQDQRPPSTQAFKNQNIRRFRLNGFH